MSALLSLVGWSFLPGLASAWLQTIYYGVTIRAGDRKPQPGSPRHAEHRRRIRILVVAAYLLYTIYEADHDLRRQPSYYQELGVPAAAADREIRSRFRRLAALHHPDKAGSEAEAYFIHLKLASDTLQDAARRFAYDRFGDAVVSWERCATVRDYVARGVVHTVLPHYAVAAATVYVLGLFGYMDFGKFYRWLILLALGLFEVHAATRAGFPPLLRAANAVVTTLTGRPPYLPFQLVGLLRKITLTAYIALSQIGPLLVRNPSPRKAAAAGEDDKALRESLARLEALSRQLDADAGRLMDMEVAPFKGDASAVNNLRGKMREWLVQNTIRADPMVRDAMGTSFKKRRINAPAGARGNR
ncbi:uncharacterized protein UV8b_00344 [Ustilaginoidea virens]|uniref:J domain-containing protein n=1 Tax=Ustilaginoidea virens TaxID=1159556 RepID=A0A8E5HIT6_USTVR|nr:uncharacterized protein UV8b_00344 [Ustilaginoidea virens]QUC16103.1 hypothetical protein UV8b_00344 [Ustilaginoidea virens]